MTHLRDPVHFFDERGRAIVNQVHLQAEILKKDLEIERLRALVRRLAAERTTSVIEATTRN